jgi:hypothetical protein
MDPEAASQALVNIVRKSLSDIFTVTAPGSSRRSFVDNQTLKSNSIKEVASMKNPMDKERDIRHINGEKYIGYVGGNKQSTKKMAEGFRKLGRHVRIIKQKFGPRVFVSGPFIDFWWKKFDSNHNLIDDNKK